MVSLIKKIVDQLHHLSIGTILIWVGIAFGLMTTFSRCEVPQPRYSLDLLQGAWLRVSSSDPRSDSMVVEIRNDSAVIIQLPSTSNFILGQTKWRSIKAIAGFGDFEFLDLSADSNSYTTFITIDIDGQDTLLDLTNRDYPAAPGGRQLWESY